MRTAKVKQIDFGVLNDYPGREVLRKIGYNEVRKHPDIDENHSYIALIDGRYYIGKIKGHNFFDGWGSCGHQFDPPGTNGCSWQKVWKVEDANGLRNPEAILLAAGFDPVQIAIDDELRYAKACRQYCIDGGMTCRGIKITEESPMDVWMYNHECYKPKMPHKIKDEDDE